MPFHLGYPLVKVKQTVKTLYFMKRQPNDKVKRKFQSHGPEAFHAAFVLCVACLAGVVICYAFTRDR